MSAIDIELWKLRAHTTKGVTSTHAPETTLASRPKGWTSLIPAIVVFPPHISDLPCCWRACSFSKCFIGGGIQDLGVGISTWGIHGRFSIYLLCLHLFQILMPCSNITDSVQTHVRDSISDRSLADLMCTSGYQKIHLIFRTISERERC